MIPVALHRRDLKGSMNRNQKTTIAVVVALGFAVGSIFGLSRLGVASRNKQDPSSWIVNGVVDESKVPPRVTISVPWLTEAGWINTKAFYAIGKSNRRSQVKIPIFDAEKGGNVIAFYSPVSAQVLKVS
jgi:hypothetical protein